MPSFSRRARQQLLHQAAKFNFAQAQMAVVVAQDLAEPFQMSVGQRLDQTLLAHRLDETFGQDDHAVLRTFGATFDDGADDDVAHFVHRDLAVAEFLGDDGEGGRGGLGDAEREMPGRASHADDDVPARGGARVLHQVAHNIDAVVAGRFITECRRGTGQGQVVVNRLGHVRDADFPEALLGHDAGGKGRVIAADGDQRGDAELFKDAEDILHLFRRLGRIRARGAENRAAFDVDVLHVTDGQRPAILHVALGEPLEAVAKADDFVTLVDAFDGGGGDDAVKARRRTAADQNS